MTLSTLRTSLKFTGIAAVVALFSTGCASTGSAGNAGSTPAAQAETQKPAGMSTSKAAAVDPAAMRCKRITETGTRVKKKVCATNAEWDIAERQAQETTREYQRAGGIGRSVD